MLLKTFKAGVIMKDARPAASPSRTAALDVSPLLREPSFRGAIA
ncbi:MAG: hypothetical protein Q8P59_14675 [Dehalococcoidia bacterium]|nr:hypothetical protein [Dehalococcoidia bacterium]